ncbi:MAG: quinone oxidoreductase [Gammaproteobacteria bacterium]|nr:MAG: quinone oxidoreductase [Gammaproteobacteria bacterium]
MRPWRALEIQALAPAPRVALVERPPRAPAPGEVAIAVEYSSLNYKDALALAGHPGVVKRVPLVGGIDAAGEVVESASPDFVPGQKVLVTGYELGQTHDGGWCTGLVVPADWVVPLPPGLDTFQAMALGTAGFTAALAYKRLLDNDQRPERGPMLVTGASGGVGGFAVNLLADQGFAVTAMTGKPTAAARLRALGAIEIVDRAVAELDDERPLLSGRWGGAIDNLGGPYLAWITRCLCRRGNVVAVGLAAGSELKTTVMPFILRGVALLGVDSSATAADLRRWLWQQLAGPWRPSGLDRMVAGVIGLDAVPAAAERLRAGAVDGRYVIAVGAAPRG